MIKSFKLWKNYHYKREAMGTLVISLVSSLLKSKYFNITGFKLRTVI